MSDPFDYRCPRCGRALLDPPAPGVTRCGADCRTPLETVRAAAAALCRRALACARWLGLAR